MTTQTNSSSKTTDATTEAKGHAAHTKPADQPAGLPGAFPRPIKVVMLGAGSAFTPRLVVDLLLSQGSQGGEVALVDIDPGRLQPMLQLVKKLIEAVDHCNWTVRASTDRCEVLADAHYLVNCIEVSGMDCVALDNDIPLKYGIDQCIGDTIGPGGLFKALRTVPVWLDVLKDAERLCPQALVLNYTNPMNMMCLAAGRTRHLPVVGLCHSVQSTSHLLAEYAEVPYEEMVWECAGINHLAWFTKLEHHGQSLYPKLHARFTREIEEAIAEFKAGLTSSDSRDHRDQRAWKHNDLVRKDMCLHFGAFITESSGHLSEYLPYYRKSDLGRRLLRTGYDGGTRFYATNWPHWRQDQDDKRQRMLRGEERLPLWRSWEFASWIIEAREKDVPYRIHGNVMNHDGSGRGQLITNLPADGCVEVACLIDRNGINPTRFGALPPQMAHICASNMAMFDLGATACIEKSKEAAIHALMLDPLCAAVCTPAQIKAMTLELFDAEARYLPGYK